ncbi:hypothetical protein GC194_14280, partial [bacterium]|nr:hypothetical protein [bacterium]
MEANVNICDKPHYNFDGWKSAPQFFYCQFNDMAYDLSAVNTSDSLEYNYHITRPIKDYSVGKHYYLFFNGKYTYYSPLKYEGFPDNNKALPAGFHLDSVTGMLKFRPTANDVTVMAVKLVARKNGKVVFDVMRDMVMFVIKCPKNDPPVISGTACRAPTERNLTKIACAGQPVCISLCAHDDNTDDTISISYKGNLPGAKFSASNSKTNKDTATLCWTPDSTNVREQPYFITFSVTDNVCPVPMTTDEVYRIYVKPYDTSISLSIIDSSKNLCGDYSFTLRDTGNTYLNEVTWYLNDTMKLGETEHINYKFTANGNYKITAVYDGCKTYRIDKNININFLKPITYTAYSDTHLCANEELKLDLNPSGGYGNLSVNWDLQYGLKNLSKRTDSTAVHLAFKNTGGLGYYKIAFTIQDTANCLISEKLQAAVYSYKENDVEQGTTFCSDKKESYPLKKSSTTGKWTGNGVVNDTFYNYLSTDTLNVLAYSSLENDFCIIDTATIKSFGAAKINAGADFGLCADAGDTLLIGIPAGGIWT